MSNAFEVYMRHYSLREFSYFSLEAKARRELPPLPSYQQFLAERDDGGYAGVVMDYILIKASGKPGKMVLSVPNEGAITGLADSDVVEISCIIDKNGVTPQHIGEIPPLQLNLMQMLKFYEKYTTQAIAEKNRDKAILALVCHPLVSSFSLAEQLVDQYLAIHKPYVGAW
jgi:6-phospho-beta-glucosidase